MVKVDRILGEIVTLLNSPPGRSQKELDERADFWLYRLEKLVEEVQDVNFFPLGMSSRLPPTTQVVMQQFIAIRITHVRMLARIKCIKAPEAFSSWSHSARSLISLATSSVDQHQKAFSASGVTGVSRLFRFLLERLLRMSVSVLIVAVSCNPQVYAPRCRTAFHTALDLLTTLQSRRGDQGPSTIISCSLAELRKIGERIHMPPLGNAPAVPAEPFPLGQRGETRPLSGPVYPQFDFPASCLSTDHDLMGNPSSNWESEFADIGFIEGILESVRGHSCPSGWKLI
ncbi:hypothetical protein F4823DRAFT_51336 [Ustulina deusta]|nr:hypothetical protein F4823DRAFT_51336 [Ustulina deusta]